MAILADYQATPFCETINTILKGAIMKTRLVGVVFASCIVCATGSALAQTKTVDAQGAFGCASRDYFEKVAAFNRQGDKEASQRALAVGLISGECSSFAVGTLVYVEDTATFSHLVKIRRKGETTGYWTYDFGIK